MLIDGEKYACEACVRGHRVSNCQHSDRPLQHINKKGRPVSQCQHCRAMRKSRASHVKCDCGEKTHKCQHLQQAVEGHDESCCCNHGGRCTCSHKKDIGQVGLDTVPESDSDEDSLQSRSTGSLRRRRAQTAISEPVLNFDENGRHKPAQKHNKAAQKTGPYSLSRGDSMHSGLANKSMENLLVRPRPSRKSTLDSLEFEQRATKSEAASPLPFQPLNLTGQLPPLDLSNIQYPEYTPSFDFFAGLSDSETPIYSAGLSAASVDWADYNGLDLNGDNFAPSSYDQSLSYTGFDFSSTEPTLASNSGDVSENEDLMPAFSEQQMEGFRQSAATSYMNMPQSQPSMLGANGDLGNVNYDQFKGAAAANKFLPNIPTPDDVAARMPYLEEDTYFPMNNDFYDGLGQSPDPAANNQFWGRQ